MKEGTASHDGLDVGRRFTEGCGVCGLVLVRQRNRARGGGYETPKTDPMLAILDRHSLR